MAARSPGEELAKLFKIVGCYTHEGETVSLQTAAAGKSKNLGPGETVSRGKKNAGKGTEQEKWSRVPLTHFKINVIPLNINAAACSPDLPSPPQYR